MMSVIPTPRFTEALRSLDSKKAKAARVALKKFLATPFLRGLNFERLGGTENYTIRADRGFRICMRKVSSCTYELVDVGNHDYINNKYG
jgi:hypothetical protein